MSQFLNQPDWTKRFADEIEALKSRINKISTGNAELILGGGGDIVGVLPTHAHGGTGQGGGTLTPKDLGFQAPTELTIAAGVITATQSRHTIDTEADAASDDLDTVNGLTADHLYVLSPANDARTVVLKHETGNISCINGADITLDDIEDFVWGYSPDGTNLYVLFDTQGAGGNHSFLSATHTDTVAASVVDGDVAIGNVTPLWSRLGIVIPAANVRNALGIDNGELRPSWKTTLDATDPAALAAAAGPGTSLVYAHRDHVHPYHASHGVAHNAVHGISKHTEHAADKLLYADSSGDEQEVSLGADGTVYVSAGATSAPVMEEIYASHIIQFPALAEDLATGVMGARPGTPVGESGEHGTFTAIRAKAIAGTAGTGTTTILIEADDNPAFSSATTLFTLALNTSTEVDDTVLDNSWAAGDIFVRARCTAVGATAPKDANVLFYFKERVENF